MHRNFCGKITNFSPHFQIFFILSKFFKKLSKKNPADLQAYRKKSQ